MHIPRPLKAGVGSIGAAANRGAALAALQRCEQAPRLLTPSSLWQSCTAYPSLSLAPRGFFVCIYNVELVCVCVCIPPFLKGLCRHCRPSPSAESCVERRVDRHFVHPPTQTHAHTLTYLCVAPEQMLGQTAQGCSVCVCAAAQSEVAVEWSV